MLNALYTILTLIFLYGVMYTAVILAYEHIVKTYPVDRDNKDKTFSQKFIDFIYKAGRLKRIYIKIMSISLALLLFGVFILANYQNDEFYKQIGLFLIFQGMWIYLIELVTLSLAIIFLPIIYIIRKKGL